MAKLVELFCPLAMNYLAITRIIRMLSWTAHEGELHDLEGRRPNSDHDARILAVLAADPIASVREIARETQIPKSTVYNILVQRLRYCSRKFRLVPHELDERQQIERVDKARALLVTLNKAKKRVWHFILTGSKSWFFYYTEQGSTWLPLDVEAPEVAQRLINTPKVMVTVFVHPTGLHVFDCLPEERSFNTAYFIDHILSKLKNCLT
jgi:DNA-binding MarR family transcriptional regulator